jgi:hypothetical protein
MFVESSFRDSGHQRFGDCDTHYCYCRSNCRIARSLCSWVALRDLGTRHRASVGWGGHHLCKVTFTKEVICRVSGVYCAGGRYRASGCLWWQVGTSHDWGYASRHVHSHGHWHFGSCTAFDDSEAHGELRLWGRQRTSGPGCRLSGIGLRGLWRAAVCGKLGKPYTFAYTLSHLHKYMCFICNNLKADARDLK